jgi:RecA-family ATPase
MTHPTPLQAADTAAWHDKLGGLKIIDPTQWHGKTIPSRDWIVPGWIPTRCVTLLYGDGGAGKSLLTMLLLTATALGGEWLGFPVKQAPVFGFFCEDDEDELQRRQDCINQKLGCEFIDLTHLKLYSGVGEDNIFLDFEGQAVRGSVTELYEKIEKFVLSSGARLVVLDTAADIFGGNEIIKSEVRAFLNKLAGLALKIDGAVVVCAHPSAAGMASGVGDGGNKAWNNTVRSRLYFERIEGDATGDLRTLTRKKSNYAKAGEAMTVRYVDGVFVRQEESPLFEGIKTRKLRAYILGEIEKRQDTMAPLSAACNSAMFLPKILCKPLDFKHKDLKDEMVRMLADGIITIDQRTARSPKGLRKCA